VETRQKRAMLNAKINKTDRPASDIDTGVVDGLKALDPDGRLEKRPYSGHRWMSQSDRRCVKTHTSAKCRKHNSPARHRTSRVQHDLTLRDAIARRYFYVRRDRWSFRTAKTHSRRRIKALLVRQCPEAADDGRAEHVRSARVD